MTQNFLHSRASQPAPAKASHGKEERCLGRADQVWCRQRPCLPADGSTGFPLLSIHQTWRALILPEDQVNKLRPEELRSSGTQRKAVTVCLDGDSYLFLVDPGDWFSKSPSIALCRKLQCGHSSGF